MSEEPTIGKIKINWKKSFLVKESGEYQKIKFGKIIKDSSKTVSFLFIDIFLSPPSKFKNRNWIQNDQQ